MFTDSKSNKNFNIACTFVALISMIISIAWVWMLLPAGVAVACLSISAHESEMRHASLSGLRDLDRSITS